MKVHRLRLNATAIRTHRYGMGSDRHNVSLLPDTWSRLSLLTGDESGDNNSAAIQIGADVLTAILHPTDSNLARAVTLVSVGLGGEMADLCAVAGNLRDLADRIEQASQEPSQAVTRDRQAQ